MDLGELTFETAKALVGMTFEVTLPEDGTATLKLDEVLAYDERKPRRARRSPKFKREPFSLYFVGPRSEVLLQGMYVLRSETLSFDGIFLVPVDQDDEVREYEAVFT